MAALTQNKIRIRLKAYESSAIEQAAREIVETAQRTGASVSGISESSSTKIAPFAFRLSTT